MTAKPPISATVRRLNPDDHSLIRWQYAEQYVIEICPDRSRYRIIVRDGRTKDAIVNWCAGSSTRAVNRLLQAVCNALTLGDPYRIPIHRTTLFSQDEAFLNYLRSLPKQEFSEVRVNEVELGISRPYQLRQLALLF